MYCLKCKTDTPDKNVIITTTVNGRRIKKSKCKICGSKKAKFLPTVQDGDIVKFINRKQSQLRNQFC